MGINILFPVGRMIGGDIDKLSPRTEADGKTPKIDPVTKQPSMQCSMGVAIPKGTEKAWWETAWGAEIYKVGAAAHPTLVANPAFSWKIIDGDSVIPNKNGKRPCDQTGYPGHWVLWFTQGWIPKRVNATGEVTLPDGAIVPGFYVQVYGEIAGNKLVPQGTAGVYLNPAAVALVGEGDRIVSSSVDTTTVGFGAAPLPPGARPVTLAAPQFGGAPPAPAAAVPAMPPAPPTPPVAQHVMLPAANGATYEQFMATGQWTDATLIQHGMMQAPAAAPPTPPGPPMGAPPVPGAVVPPTAPSQSFLTPGAPPAPGGYAPVPPTPPAAGPVMLPAAQGVTYEAFKAQNWTDEQLRAQGMMQ